LRRGKRGDDIAQERWIEPWRDINGDVAHTHCQRRLSSRGYAYGQSKPIDWLNWRRRAGELSSPIEEAVRRNIVLGAPPVHRQTRMDVVGKPLTPLRGQGFIGHRKPPTEKITDYRMG
jgi:hypothetical protein